MNLRDEKLELHGFGVCLKKLSHDEIEMVRLWRTSEEVARCMEYRDEITPEMQEKWFQKINNENNFFFIMMVGNEKVGLMNLKDIKYDKKEGEGGIFIARKEYLNGDSSFKFAVLFNDFCFNELGMTRIVAHILNDNKRAIRYNKFIGYALQPNQENIYNRLYILEKDVYLSRRQTIVNLFN